MFSAAKGARATDVRPDWLRLALPLALLLLVSFAVHLVFIDGRGHVRDLDEYVSWIRRIALDGVPHAYDERLSYPPVMVYLWGLVGTLAPAFRTATDSSDPGLLIIIKLPSVLADLLIAGGVAWYLRASPRWALVGAAAIALNPAVLLNSAWWGQYDSLYLLGGLVTFLLAMSGRRDASAVALGITLMTKPQAFPFAIALGGYFLGRYHLSGFVRLVAISAATAVVLWIPFVPAGGPGNYLTSVGDYQTVVFPFFSVYAWNVWAILQAYAGDGFVSDATALAGPITIRMAAYGVAALLELAVFSAIVRNATPARLAIGTAAAFLVAFAVLTSMHERYSFAVLVPLALLARDHRGRSLLVAASALIIAQLVSALDVPASALLRAPAATAIGSVLMLALTVAVVWLVLKPTAQSLGDEGDAVGDAYPAATPLSRTRRAPSS